MLFRSGFSIDAKHIYEDTFKSYVENGIWYIKDNYNNRNNINLFGISFPIHFGSGNVFSPSIVITVPKGFEAENLEIELGAGEMTFEKLATKSFDLSVGAGAVNGRTLTIANHAQISVGAGSINIKDFLADTVDMDCGVGSMRIDGSISGDADIECNVGEIKLDLTGDEDDYNYIVDCGIGEIRINNARYSFNNKEKIYNKNAKATFDLNCGVGSIKIDME